MRLASIILASTLFVGAVSLHAEQTPSDLDEWSGTFTLSTPTQIPGGTLKPGEYSIRLVDRLMDRLIVRVDSSTSKDHSIFLAVSQPGIGTQNTLGPVKWKVAPNGTPALRGFRFSPGSIEFVYPKEQAAALAKVNSEGVIAVDPDSEERPVVQNMSPDDLQEVTLWMLSLNTTNPQDKTPALLAQRYKPDAGSSKPAITNTASTSPSQPTQVASLEKPPLPQSGDSSSPVKHPRAIAKLPHTASPLPLIWLAGLFSLLGAAIIRLLRTRAGKNA